LFLVIRVVAASWPLPGALKLVRSAAIKDRSCSIDGAT
jgi:hypothetical protein